MHPKRHAPDCPTNPLKNMTVYTSFARKQNRGWNLTIVSQSKTEANVFSPARDFLRVAFASCLGSFHAGLCACDNPRH